jgi:hypothetical protein
MQKRLLVGHIWKRPREYENHISARIVQVIINKEIHQYPQRTKFLRETDDDDVTEEILNYNETQDYIKRGNNFLGNGTKQFLFTLIMSGVVLLRGI